MKDVNVVLSKASLEARTATNNHLSRYGNHDLCGFAWVTVKKVRINSELGKKLVAVGFCKAYSGGLELWNPSNSHTQSITAKEKGAEAYAKVLRDELGVEAYAGSRLD